MLALSLLSDGSEKPSSDIPPTSEALQSGYRSHSILALPLPADGVLPHSYL